MREIPRTSESPYDGHEGYEDQPEQSLDEADHHRPEQPEQEQAAIELHGGQLEFFCTSIPLVVLLNSCAESFETPCVIPAGRSKEGGA